MSISKQIENKYNGNSNESEQLLPEDTVETANPELNMTCEEWGWGIERIIREGNDTKAGILSENRNNSDADYRLNT